MTLRIDHLTSDADLFGSGKDGFTAGEVSTQTPATVVTATWLNDMQEAVAQAIEGRGITLAADTHDQLLTAIRNPAVLTPSSIGSTQHNYNPASFATSDLIRITPTAGVTITGFDSTAKHPRILYNTSGTYSVTIPNDSGSSSAGNRVVTQNNSDDFVLAPRSSALLYYDTVTSNWRLFFEGFNSERTYNFANGLTYAGDVRVDPSVTRTTTKMISLLTGYDVNLLANWSYSSTGAIDTPTDGAFYVLTLPPTPSESIITNIRCGVTVVGAPGGSGNEPVLAFYRTNPDKGGGGIGATTLLSSQAGTNAAGTYVISLGAISTTIDNGDYNYNIVLTSAAGGATSTKFNWLEYTFTDVILSNR